MRSPPPGFGSPSKLVGTGAAGPSSSIASTDEIKTPPLIFDRGFEPVSAETQPVSRRLPVQISDIEKSPSRDSMEVLPPSVRDARISSPETGLLAANLRKCRHFRECPKTPATDRYGWLSMQSVSDRSPPNRSHLLTGKFTGVFGVRVDPTWLRRQFSMQDQMIRTKCARVQNR
jgi:hypothetical protein